MLRAYLRLYNRNNAIPDHVTNNFYIFGLFNCHPFGRNVVPLTDFLLVSCTTVELCCTATVGQLHCGHLCVCFQIRNACYLVCATVFCPMSFKQIGLNNNNNKKNPIQLSSCCFSNDEKDRNTWLQLIKYV